MKISLTIFSLSLAFWTVQASTGQLSATQLERTLEVDTIPDNPNCKEEIRALEEEVVMLQEEIWEIED